MPSEATRGEPEAFYRVDFRIDDCDPLQARLNDLYSYEHDLVTKVLHRNRLNLFVSLMQDLIRQGAITRFDSALDVGCNAGAYARILSDLGFRSVLGIDIDEALIARARDAFSGASGRAIEFRVEDAQNLETDSEYDFVLCTEVIEHTAAPDAVLSNIERSLKPGGVAVVSLPNGFSYPYLVTRLIHVLRGRLDDPDLRAHLRYPFYRSARMFEGSRLELLGLDGTNLFLDPLTLRLLYRTSLFGAINAANFQLSRLGPLRYLSQFLFLVAKKR